MRSAERSCVDSFDEIVERVLLVVRQQSDGVTLAGVPGIVAADAAIRSDGAVEVFDAVIPPEGRQLPVVDFEAPERVDYLPPGLFEPDAALAGDRAPQ